MGKIKVIPIISVYVFIFSCIFFLPNITTASIYYVDGNSGSDSNNGQSEANAFRTMNKANQILQPGDTVYIKAGTYSETIRPSRSGTAGNYITYATYNNDEVIITNVGKAVNLVDRHYIIIDGFKCLDQTDQAGWVDMRGNSTRNIIKNNYFETAADRWAGLYMSNGAQYNQILNNTFIGTCGYDDLVYCKDGCNYNLFEGNYLQGGAHVALELQTKGGSVHHNIVRNNTIKNQWHTGLNIHDSSNYFLAEGNIIIDSGSACGTSNCHENLCSSSSTDPEHPRTGEHRGFQLGSSYGIVRNNVFINNARGLTLNSGSRANCNYNRIYQNTFYQNHQGIATNTGNYALYENILKNNILYDNNNLEIRRTIGGSPNNNSYLDNNILGASIQWQSAKFSSVSNVQNAYPQYWSNNYSLNPKFINESARDLSLQPTSPMIDAGDFLTKTTSSGSGTTIPVADARYFMDGWGIINGDLIQLEGQNQTARITNVDYNNNIITVDTPLTWTNGQGVSLAYNGSTPDIGAYEYGGSPPPPTTYQCNDSIDNDGDGLIDYPADPGCISATDDDEYNAPSITYQCSDSIDNDGDGLIDYPADPGCISATDDDEYNAPSITYQCSDSIDNDGDGLIDYLQDPGCTSATDDDEYNSPPSPFSQYYETESMNLTSPMTIGNDAGASGGQYISPTSGAGSSSPVPEATVDFTIPQTGIYYLWIRMMGPDSQSDALYVGVDTTWDRIYPATTNAYEWIKVEISHNTGNYSFNLAQGNHTFQIGHGEINARADALFLTNDPFEMPSNIPSNQPPMPPSGFGIQ